MHEHVCKLHSISVTRATTRYGWRNSRAREMEPERRREESVEERWGTMWRDEMFKEEKTDCKTSRG